MASRSEVLRGRLHSYWVRLEPHWNATRDLVALLGERVRPATSIVTSLGWGVFGFGLACWMVAWRLAWTEAGVLATASWTLLLAAALLTIGKARLTVELSADPQRVVVGAPAAGAVRVRNISRRPLLPIGLELPIGVSAARFTLPLLQSNAEHEELFVVPTARRGVVVVGPAMTVRGDPIGLYRRAVSWTESLEIFVHPITVRLESSGAGLLRDLEGQTTNEISMSDLAFHALREYQPGDDRRHIHWRSSAKAGRFLVRQFLDTRRSHVCILVDSDARSYADPEDYELAISAAASLAVRTVQDEQQVTVLAGEHAAPETEGIRVLDTFARAELSDHGLADLARRAARIAPDTSMALLVTGSQVPFEQIQRAANDFPIEVKVLALQVDPTRPTGIRESRGLTVLTLQRLTDLAGLLLGAAS